MYLQQKDAFISSHASSLQYHWANIQSHRDRHGKKMILPNGTSLIRIIITLLFVVRSTSFGADPHMEHNFTIKAALKLHSTAINQDHQLHTFATNLSKNKSWKLLHFTDWSEWSVCNRHCIQNRIRRCRLKHKCSNTVIREERVCNKEKKRCKSSQNRYTRKRERFHIVQNPKEAEPRQSIRRGNKNVREKPSSHYGKWSKWSPCTRSCTTQRRRWCKIPGICGRDVIRESAYCYVEGSFCQRWIRRKIRGDHNDDNADLVPNELEHHTNTIENIDHVKNNSTWRCGIVDNPEGKKLRLSSLTRIIGGRPATPGSWPWQVAILNRFREAFCGGTLISPKWVLTAAHCIRKRLFVRIGEHDLTIKEGTELELKVDSIVVHPKYDADTVDNDIALLRLPITLTPSSSRGIACLPTPHQPLPTKHRCTITGWGKSRTNDDFGTDVLYEAQIPIVSSHICRGVYVAYQITENMFCAGDLRGRMDSCNGDSGGPLLCKDPRRPDNPWTIYGITSFGEGCGKPGKFGIYARITNYVRWITKVINEEN